MHILYFNIARKPPMTPKRRNLFIHHPLQFSLLSLPAPACVIPLFTASFPWPQGAVSYLDAGALL